MSQRALVSFALFLLGFLLAACCPAAPSADMTAGASDLMMRADLARDQGEDIRDLTSTDATSICQKPCSQSDPKACGSVPSLCYCPRGMNCCCVG